MMHGVAGLLERRVCVLDDKLKSAMDIELLKRTPSSYLGSCRYKLPDPDVDATPFVKPFTLFDKYDICALFYIGGNDWRLIPLYISEETTPWIPSASWLITVPILAAISALWAFPRRLTMT